MDKIELVEQLFYSRPRDKVLVSHSSFCDDFKQAWRPDQLGGEVFVEEIDGKIIRTVVREQVSQSFCMPLESIKSCIMTLEEDVKNINESLGVNLKFDLYLEEENEG